MRTEWNNIQTENHSKCSVNGSSSHGFTSLWNGWHPWRGEIQGNEMYLLKHPTWQQADFSIKARCPYRAQDAGDLALGLQWPEASASCSPAPCSLFVSLWAPSSIGKLCVTVLFFPPVIPAGFNVRINKTVFVDVFELPGRKALREVINSLAWIISSWNMELWKCEKNLKSLWQHFNYSWFVCR